MNNNASKLIFDPIIQKFINALAAQPSTPLYKLSVQDARAVLDTVQKAPVAQIPVERKDRTIPGGSFGPISIRIIRPQGNTHALPAIIYMHGGGWVLGNATTHDRLVSEIAHGAQAAVVFVNYTLAPEGQFPLAHEQGYAAAQWVAEQSGQLNIDAKRIAIVGDSVGGLMATAIALMAQERGGPSFIAQVLLYPVTDANFNTASYEQFAQGPWLTKAAMEWFWDNYVPNKADRNNPYACPLKASLEQLKDLPPALVITNEYDVLRDEGEAYAHTLVQAGVSVVAMRQLGMIHDCLMLNPITQTPTVRATIDLVNQWPMHYFAKK